MILDSKFILLYYNKKRKSMLYENICDLKLNNKAEGSIINKCCESINKMLRK